VLPGCTGDDHKESTYGMGVEKGGEKQGSGGIRKGQTPPWQPRGARCEVVQDQRRGKKKGKIKQKKIWESIMKGNKTSNVRRYFRTENQIISHPKRKKKNRPGSTQVQVGAGKWSAGNRASRGGEKLPWQGVGGERGMDRGGVRTFRTCH